MNIIIGLTYLIVFVVFAVLYAWIAFFHLFEYRIKDKDLKKDYLFCVANTKSVTWLNISTLWIMFGIFISVVSFVTFGLLLYASLYTEIEATVVIVLSTISLICSMFGYVINTSFHAQQYRKAFDRIKPAINNYIVDRKADTLTLALNESELMTSECFK